MIIHTDYWLCALLCLHRIAVTHMCTQFKSELQQHIDHYIYIFTIIHLSKFHMQKFSNCNAKNIFERPA